MSGSNGDPTMEAKYYEAFGTWRGRPDDVAMLYTDRSSWTSVTSATMFVFSFMKGWPGKLVISQPPFPSDGSDLAHCAAGDYDASWKTFGTSLVTNSRSDSIVRIGWEFNGDFNYWHATNDTSQFIQCWNHVAAAIKSTDPQVLLDWTINGHATPSDSCMGDARNCYPGDANVDYIGIDYYDEYPPSTKTAFATTATNPGGISWIYDFAVAHHKRFSVGEWGVVSGAGTNGGGDNPAYIQNMRSWFEAHTAIGLYESYFNISTEVDSRLVDNTTGACGCDNPMASAKYQQLWK
jgi:beta-mannanase